MTDQYKCTGCGDVKPCPFCGDDSLAVFDNKDDELGNFIACAGCGASKHYELQSKYSTIADQWNTRPIEDSLRADLAALRELLGEVAGLLKEKGLAANYHSARCDDFSQRECTCGANDMCEFCSELKSRVQQKLEEK